MQGLLSDGLSSGVVGLATTSSRFSLQMRQDQERTTFAYSIYLRKYAARFTSATIMG
jgi:hypothetical protein